MKLFYLLIVCFNIKLTYSFQTLLIGTIRAESFTRVPQPITSTSTVANAIDDCEQNSTQPGDVEPQESSVQEENEARLLKQHYNSYNAALGVTVGVGCLLLLLNVLMFAGICYQRNRQRRRTRLATSEGDVDSPSMTQLSTIPEPPPPPPPKKSIPPEPPTRTSSNQPSGSVKKRVQIQEISV